jgi:predicted transcriptional regulator of viral defense system
MNFESLAARAQRVPVFGDELLSRFPGSRAARRNQLTRWTAAGKLIRLKRGLYTLCEDRRRVPLPLGWLANTIYSPSYVSLQYALSRYDLIPERVGEITSVTTLKTAAFKNPLGFFRFRHVAPSLFFGFEETRDESGYPLLIATPEKAILDTIYLTPHWEPTRAFLQDGVRLQQLGSLRRKRLKEFASKYGSSKVQRAAKTLMEATR